MRQNEKKAVAKLVRHIQELHRENAAPTREDATDEEVITLFELLWEWTPYPRYQMPSKHVIEQLVGFMRGCEPCAYCYISRDDVSRIIRENAERHDMSMPLRIELNKYDRGKWNYKPSPLVDMLLEMHHQSL